MATKAKRQRIERTTKKELILTPGETLFLWRKRARMDQTKAAKKYGCSLFNFKKAEYDEPVNNFNYDKIIIAPQDNEKCVIYRKRADLFQHEIARSMGVSRTWINRQEKGLEDCSKLLAYWEG